MPHGLGLGLGHADRGVCKFVVGGGLVGKNIDLDVAGDEALQQLDGVALDTDGDGGLRSGEFYRAIDGLVDVEEHFIEVAVLLTAQEGASVRIRNEAGAAVHGDGQRLGTAHAAAASGDAELAGQRTAKVLAAQFCKSFVGSLNDALGADVNPTPCGHLAVHHQPFGGKLIKVLLRGPVGHEIAVGDHDAGRIGGGFDDADGLARLHEERFIGLEFAEAVDDGIKALPVAGGLASATIDDQRAGLLGHFRVEVVHEHAQRGLGLPGFARHGHPAGGPNFAPLGKVNARKI